MPGYYVSTKKGYLYETDFRGYGGTVQLGSITLADTDELGGIVYWVAPNASSGFSFSRTTSVTISRGEAVTRCVGIYKSDVAPGTIISYAGDKQPLGFIRCNGQQALIDHFPDLYAAIGRTWGTTASQDYFLLPDTRGQFERDLDDGKKLDPDTARALGSRQEAGAPNITGEHGFQSGGAAAREYTKGAFFNGENNGAAQTLGASYSTLTNLVKIDASRSSSIYQDGLNEVRPVNYAIRKYIKY